MEVEEGPDYTEVIVYLNVPLHEYKVFDRNNAPILRTVTTETRTFDHTDNIIKRESNKEIGLLCWKCNTWNPLKDYGYVEMVKYELTHEMRRWCRTCDIKHTKHFISYEERGHLWEEEKKLKFNNHLWWKI